MLLVGELVKSIEIRLQGDCAACGSYLLVHRECKTIAQSVVAHIGQTSVFIITCLHQRAVEVHQPSAQIDRWEQFSLERTIRPVAGKKREFRHLGIQGILLCYQNGIMQGKLLCISFHRQACTQQPYSHGSKPMQNCSCSHFIGVVKF